MNLIVPAFGLLMVIGACTSRTTTGESDVALPTPDVAPDRAPAVPPSAPLSSWKPPFHVGPTLGQPCSAMDSPPSYPQAAEPAVRADPICGTKNRVSLELVHAAGSFLEAPCKLGALDPAHAQGFERAFCTVGDELVISTTCYMCRMMNVGEVAHARLSELTPEQNQLLAQIAGLPTAPRDANEWRALAGQAQVRPTPSP